MRKSCSDISSAFPFRVDYLQGAVRAAEKETGAGRAKRGKVEERSGGPGNQSETSRRAVENKRTKEGGERAKREKEGKNEKNRDASIDWHADMHGHDG